MKISHYWKAVTAAVAAGAASLGTAVQDSTITGAEVWTAIGAALAALGFTWVVPNRAPSTGEDAKA